MRYLSMKLGWCACAVLFLLLFVASEAIYANMPSHGQFNIAATLAVLFGGIPGNLDDIVAASLQSHY